MSELLCTGADVSTKGLRYTALMYAVLAGHKDCVNELVQAGADMNLVVSADNSVLKKKAREKTMALISSYLLADETIEERKKKAEIRLQENESVNIQSNALKIAVQKGNVECARDLIIAGADVNDSTMSVSALIFAATKGNLTCLKMLIVAGADVNYAANCGVTALHMAARGGHVDCVKALIAAGADVNRFSQHHNTVTMTAAEKGHVGCLEELIKAGADVNIVNLDGDTAVMCAAITGKGQCLSTLIEAELM